MSLGSDFSKKEEPPMVALIVADYFDSRFKPLIGSSSWGMVKVVNIEILNHTLEWISRTEINDVLIAISDERSESIRSVTNYWENRFNSLVLVFCNNCASVGDAVREVYSRSLIKGDFLLISNPATFCSSNLKREIAKYRSRRKDKSNVMTLFFYQNEGNNPIIGINGQSQKLTSFYHNTKSRFATTKGAFLSNTVVRKDLKDSGIALCAINVASQFSDNFDYQYRDDVIKELLVNEDILNLNIHIEVFPPNVMAISITDYEDLLTVNSFISMGWMLPMIPGNIADYSFSSFRNNVFLSIPEYGVSEPTIQEKNMIKTIGPNVVLGRCCKIGANVSISSSSVGDNTKIGEKSFISLCLIGENVKIGSNVQLKRVVVGNNVFIGDNVTIGSNSLLANEVLIPDKSVIEPDYFICTNSYVNDDDFIECSASEYGKILKLKNGNSLWHNAISECTSLSSSEEELSFEDDYSESEESEKSDHAERFFEEVKESMQRIEEENKNDTDEQFIKNLILEINSSKLSNNISMENVAYYVFLSFLSLNQGAEFTVIKDLAERWKKLFLNYFTPVQNQIQALRAVEEYIKLVPSFKSKTAAIVHAFYTLDVLTEDSIISWYSKSDETSSLRRIIQPIVNWLQEAEEEN